MSAAPIHVVHVLPAYRQGEPATFFDYGYAQVEMSAALAARGIQVTVLSRFGQAATVQQDGVCYEFVPDRLGERLRFWQVSKPIIKRVRALAPDIVHFHGLHYPFMQRMLSKG